MVPDPPGLLVVTGATGWVGRTALDELARRLSPPEFQARVRAFASRTGRIRLAPLAASIEVRPLTQLPALAEERRLDAILHAAFLTPEHAEAMGSEAYAASNRAITARVCEALQPAGGTRVVAISSGAAAAATTTYGRLKREEEQRLQARAETLVLRIHALSGRYLREPRRYALGDFLGQALTRGRIELSSTVPVIRGYVHAGTLAQLAWAWLLGSDSAPAEPLAAVSHSLELLELARLIARRYRLPDPIAAIDAAAPASAYTADPGPFRAFLARHGVRAASLEEQIADTALAISCAADARTD